MLDPTQTNSADESSSQTTLLAIAVGNTRTRVGVLQGRECVKAQSIASDDAEAIASYASSLFEEFEFISDEPVILMSTVDQAAADTIEETLRERFRWSCYRIGRDLDLPIRHTLTESGEATVGQDRLLCALGAFDIVKQACVVVDMGTAITVDFIDGEGTFHGGAIMPGVRTMLRSLHESTAHLPEIKYRKLDPKSSEPSKQTDDAMILGVTASVSGGIRYLAERYAQFYEGYPQIIATGGDIGVLEDDELIETIIPDLQLQGIRIACKAFLSGDDEFDDDDQTSSD